MIVATVNTVVLGSATATSWHVIEPLSQQAVTGAELPRVSFQRPHGKKQLRYRPLAIVT